MADGDCMGNGQTHENDVAQKIICHSFIDLDSTSGTLNSATHFRGSIAFCRTNNKISSTAIHSAYTLTQHILNVANINIIITIKGFFPKQITRDRVCVTGG